MKRRNADAGKMRRPLKRTKITEGMYGNSMLYLKFVMLWATVVLADYMLEFRFEFLWPFWMMLRSVYDSFKYQGLAFSMFFICIALTSDMICFFFIPLQYIFFAASTYVWVQYVWYTFAEKGICLPTVAICCVVVYVEGAWRGERCGAGELCRPLAAHCVGFPAVSLGFGVKSYVGHRLRLRTQRHVREQNEFYFQLMRDALPEAAIDQSQQPPTKETATASSAEAAGSGGGGGGGTSTSTSTSTSTTTSTGTESRHMNGSVRRRCNKPELNGHCSHEHTQLHIKLEKLEKHLAQQTAAREREKAQNHTQTHSQTQASAGGAQGQAGGGAQAHALANGSVPNAHVDDDDHRHDHSKGGAKSSKNEKKEANSLKEEKRKNRHKDKDKESTDSHKSTENVKEQIVKEKDVESTKENVKSKECNNNKDKEKEKEKDKEREREKERETKEREKKKEEEKERERERELRSMRGCAEELRRVRAELAAARSAEADARRALAAAERQRRHQNQHQHKASWRGARPSAELARARPAPRTTSAWCGGECESEWCRAALSRAEGEAAALRRDLARATDALSLLRADLHRAADQVRSLEARQEARQEEAAVAGCAGGAGSGGAASGRGGGASVGGVASVGASWQALQERAAHLERSLSAETRVKLDLLSALGDAKRKMHLQEGVISRQEKEIEELKAQMLAVMPAEFVTAVSGAVSKLRLADGSPLDPNASVYTPKQLCSDA